MPWTPPPRAAWVDRVAALGRGLGDDGRSVVDLSPEILLDAARRTTELDDTGDDWFHQPLDVLCAGLDDEAELHLAGRLRARAELQLLLQNRLRLVQLWKDRPDLPGGAVTAPVFVTGLGRSGTTLVHELLACDPANRAPLLWELLHTPGPSPGSPGDPQGDLGRLADAEIKVMDEMVPDFTGMHENGGVLPTECIFAFAHQFSSDLFVGLYDLPAYTVWRSGLDTTPLYEWHRAMLATLADGDTERTWVLKAPSHLTQMATLFATYPDARVVITHRDPLRVVGSLADMMATLRWMHSDRVDHAAISSFLATGLVFQMDRVVADRDEGRLPGDRIADVRYADLVADPIGTVEDLYGRWGRPVTEEFAANLRRYVASRHTGRAVTHRYDVADTGLDVGEHRPLLAAYQERFGVRSEV